MDFSNKLRGTPTVASNVPEGYPSRTAGGRVGVPLKLFEKSFRGTPIAELVYLEGYPYSTSGRS